MIGINKFKINEKLNANFALRNVPTSFGYFAGGDFFLEINKSKILMSLGVFRLSGQIVLAADMGYKTKGWLFGNPYLDNNLSARLKLRINTN